MPQHLLDMNTTNVLPSFSSCDAMAEMVQTVKNEILIQSVVFDLIAGMISSGFVYKFYQGVEISHPIYAIVFTNIVLSTFLSFVSFLCAIIDMIVVSCIPFYLRVYINGSAVHTNIISWMVIAFLRYFLLVTTKSENEDYVTDLPKIRMVALISNWCTIIVVCIFRGLLLFPHFKNEIPLVFRISINGGLLFALLMITFFVYYRLDVELKKKQHMENVKRQTELEQPKNTDDVFSTKSNHLENATNANTLQHHRTGGVQKVPLNVCDSNVKCSASDPSNRPVFKKVFRKEGLMNNRVGSYSPSTENQEYGGIYIGNTIRKDTSGYNERELSSTNDKRGDATEETEEQEHQRVHIRQYKDSRDKRITAILNEPLTSVNSNEKLTRQKVAGFVEDKTSSSDDLYVLPNQVCHAENIITAVVQVHVESCKSQTEQSPKTHHPSEPVISHLNNDSDLREAPKRTHGTESIMNDELDRISVIQEPNTPLSSPPPFPEQTELHTGTNTLSEDDEGYKSSKEHKSIVRAIITNSLYIGMVFLLAVVMLATQPLQNRNVSLYVGLSVIIKLYRTFATIFSAIYCFEIVHILFLQIVDNIKDYLQNFYDRIRTAF